MLNFRKCKAWWSQELVRAHLCTLAVSVGANATWRVPRGAFLYGAPIYGLALTAASLAVALPVVLLQLTAGQLSRRDAVGVWSAVPFFTGIGYLRIIISFIGSAYTIIYVSITIALLLYTATNSIPFPECTEWLFVEDAYENTSVNASQCFSATFLSPVGERPEYYISIAFVLLFLWIATFFVFYNPIKFMRWIFYASGPVVLALGIVIIFGIGDKSNMETYHNALQWNNYSGHGLWHGAIVQALWSCQVAGGYLISAGDSVYSDTNVQWTSFVVVGSNIISSWVWLIFWFGVGGTGDKDTTVLAVLGQTYQVAVNKRLNVAYPLLIFAMLIMSGVISILSLLYPVNDRLRRIGGIKWRYVTFASTFVGAGVSLAVLAGGLQALTLIEDVAVPLLICIATVLESLAFGLIYGWENLTEDVEFLIGADLHRLWAWGWRLSPAIVAAVTGWWAATSADGRSPATIALAAAGGLAALVTLASGCGAMIVQLHYDPLAKLKSSFKPSRHWGPRDPVTRHRWLALRDARRGIVPRTLHGTWDRVQLSGTVSSLTLPESVQSTDGPRSPEGKERSNSDDWLYTLSRKECLSQLYGVIDERKRSKSLDWEVTIKKKGTYIVQLNNKPVFSVEKNNNVLRDIHIKSDHY